MGDCSSRPKTDDVTKHVTDRSTKHDPQFYAKPDLSFASDIDTMEEIKTADEMDLHRAFLKQLDDFKKSVFEYEKAVTTKLNDKDWVEEKRLLVEIQRGKELHYPHTCFNEVNLYVRLRLEPGMPSGKDLITRDGRNDIPKWGRCFSLHMSKEYSSLVLTIMVKRKRFSEEEFGKIIIKLRNLAGQEMKYDWFPVTTTYTQNEKPAVLMRIQNITDERALLLEHRQACIEARSRTEEYIRKCKGKIDRGEERIGPEGRG